MIQDLFPFGGNNSHDDAPKATTGIFHPTDICANKHQGNAESVAAHDSIKPSLPKRRMLILSIFLTGRYTPKQVASMMLAQLNTISGRFTELKEMGLLEPTGDRVEGSAVLRLTVEGRDAAEQYIKGESK
tara:strand:+ start:479 stop:868 length:390 start_codon:yes stop_codon:yes gene_type:complete